MLLETSIETELALRNVLSDNINLFQGVFTISESVNDAGRMRHAVIRRHQSLYIHPKTTSDVTSSSHFKFQDQVKQTNKQKQIYRYFRAKYFKYQIRTLD